MPSATSIFTLDVFETDEPYEVVEGVSSGRTRIEKTFRGDLEGTSTVQMLSVQAEGGAAYVALETLRGSIEGRTGTFALVHAGTMQGEEFWARWTVAPGSGTGGLAGIRGEAKIEIASDGTHTLVLDYEL